MQSLFPIASQYRHMFTKPSGQRCAALMGRLRYVDIIQESYKRV